METTPQAVHTISDMATEPVLLNEKNTYKVRKTIFMMQLGWITLRIIMQKKVLCWFTENSDLVNSCPIPFNSPYLSRRPVGDTNMPLPATTMYSIVTCFRTGISIIPYFTLVSRHCPAYLHNYTSRYLTRTQGFAYLFALGTLLLLINLSYVEARFTKKKI